MNAETIKPLGLDLEASKEADNQGKAALMRQVRDAVKTVERGGIQALRWLVMVALSYGVIIPMAEEANWHAKNLINPQPDIAAIYSLKGIPQVLENLQSAAAAKRYPKQSQEMAEFYAKELARKTAIVLNSKPNPSDPDWKIEDWRIDMTERLPPEFLEEDGKTVMIDGQPFGVGAAGEDKDGKKWSYVFGRAKQHPHGGLDIEDPVYAGVSLDQAMAQLRKVLRKSHPQLFSSL